MSIHFDHTDESGTYVASRPVHNSQHANGTIEQGARVFFRRDAETRRVVLLTEETGEPTNGNQYLEFPDVLEAEGFANWVGLVPTPEEN